MLCVQSGEALAISAFWSVQWAQPARMHLCWALMSITSLFAGWRPLPVSNKMGTAHLSSIDHQYMTAHWRLMLQSVINLLKSLESQMTSGSSIYAQHWLKGETMYGTIIQSDSFVSFGIT